MKMSISKMVEVAGRMVQTSQVISFEGVGCGDDFTMHVCLDEETSINFAKMHILPEEESDDD